MVVCSVFGCRNRSGQKTDIQKQKEAVRKISFHRFPDNADLRRAWLDAIQRQDWTPYKSAAVCSEHFEQYYFDESPFYRKLKNTAVPTKFPINNCKIPEKIPIKQEQSDAVTCDIVEVSSTTQNIVEVSSTTQNIVSHKEQSLSAPSPTTTAPLPLPQTIHLLISTTTSLSPERKRTRPLSPTKETLIRNYKYKLSVYKRTIKTLQQKTIRLKKRFADLKFVLNELKKKKYINEELKNMLENIPDIHKEILNRELKPVRTYSPAVRKFALTLHYFSSTAYSYAREKFYSCLPHPKIITKWYQVIDGKPGFTVESFEAVKNKIKNLEHDLYFSLIIDEMALRRNVEFDGDQSYGYVDLGNGIQNEKSPVAKDALVFLLVGLNVSWKIPIAYFLTDCVNGEQKCNLINECLDICFSNNIRIVSITFDGASANFTMAKMLGCQLNPKGNLKTWFEFNNNKIFIFLDPCHMLKLITNTFGEMKIFKSDGSKISWEYIEKLHSLQEKDLHLANKLHSQHLYFQKEKMKVKLASQLFSNSVADALEINSNELKLKSFEGSAATIEFIRKLNILFEIFNSRDLKQINFKKPLHQNNSREIFYTLSDTYNYIKSLKGTMNNKPIYLSSRKTGFVGLLICIESLMGLFRELCEKENTLHYIPTYKLSQDHMELLFGTICSYERCNNPTARQFTAAYKKVLIHSELKESDKGNSIPLDQISTLHASSSINAINKTSGRNRLMFDVDNGIDNDNYLDNVLGDHNYCSYMDDTSEFSTYAVTYISGFVARRLMKKLICEECVNALFTKNNVNLKNYCLISFKTCGGLIFPSHNVVNICNKIEIIFKQKLKENKDIIQSPNFVAFVCTKILNSFINTNIFSSLDSHITDNDSLVENHVGHLIKCIIHEYLELRIHYLNKQIINKSENQRHWRNKISLLKRS